MSRQEYINDSGLEALRKGAFIDNVEEYPTRYTHRTEDQSLNRLNTDAYGDLVTVNNNAIIAGHGIYGFIPANFNTYTANGGSANTSNGLMNVSSSSTIYSYGVIRSFRSSNTKEGVGIIMRMGAVFSEAVAETESGIGLINLGDEVSFGFKGTDFGIWHRYGGKHEVQTLTLNVGAGGSETAALTLGGVLYSIPITSGSVQKNAKEIAEYINANSTTWEAYQLNDKVIISALSDGDKTGTFSYATSIGGTSAGSLTESTQGVTKTSVHIKQSLWNGESPNGFNPLKGNVFQIIFKGGFGDIAFYILSSEKNKMVKVHTIKWANNNTTPNSNNSSMHCGMYAYSVGATTSISVKSTFMTVYSNSTQKNIRNTRGYSNTKSISTTPTNIFTLRTKKIFNNVPNQSEIEPIHLTLSNEGAKNAVFEIWTNVTLGGTYNFQTLGTNLISDVDVAGTTITGGSLLASFTVAKGASIQVNLKEFGLRFPPSLRVSIVGYQTAGASSSDLTASLVWYEDLY